MNINIAEQLAAVTIFFVFFMGVTFGVVGGAVYGSVFEDSERSLLAAAPDRLSAGARFIFGLFRLDDDGYLERMLHRNGQLPASQDERRGDDPGAQRTDPRR